MQLLTAKRQFAAPYTAGPDDPMYQRVGAIVDDMAARPTETTLAGRRTSIRPPSCRAGMRRTGPGQGTNVRQIGGQSSMTVP